VQGRAHFVLGHLGGVEIQGAGRAGRAMDSPTANRSTQSGGQLLGRAMNPQIDFAAAGVAMAVPVWRHKPLCGGSTGHGGTLD